MISKSKFYYNINITSNPKPGEFESDANFSVVLNQALINDAHLYQFLLQKFKIDTESIPLFHVELQQPQPPVVNNTNYITNYIVYVVVGGVKYEVRLLYSRPHMLRARVIKTEGGLVYYDNREFVFAVYSYDFFITMVNDAIRTLYLNSGIADDPPFFAYDHDSEKISFYQSDANVVYFSMNLFPYVGEGFNTTWYYIKPPLIDLMSIQLRLKTMYSFKRLLRSME